MPEDTNALVPVGASPPTVREERDCREITVNGRRHLVASDEVSHDQLVRMAYPGVGHVGGRSYTVTYRGGPTGAAEGSLVPRQRAQIIDGETTFSVYCTDRS